MRSAKRRQAPNKVLVLGLLDVQQTRPPAVEQDLVFGLLKQIRNPTEISEAQFRSTLPRNDNEILNRFH